MLKPFPDASAAPLIHIAREPIHDRAGHVDAYELLFRDTADNAVATPARTKALTQLIVAAFTEFGIDELVGRSGCFVAVNRDFLTGVVPVPFTPGRATLLLAEPFPVDEAALAGAATLARRGFPIAVDVGVAEESWGPFLERLFALVSDVILHVPGDLSPGVPPDVAAAGLALRRRWAPYPRVRLIAGHLDTDAQYQRALALDFTLFQGAAVGRPGVASRPGLSTTAAARLRLIALLSREDVDIDDVAAAVAEDPAVSYRLLHAAGAAASGRSSRVSSLTEAVMLLGLDRIQGWVTLMLLSDGAALDQHRGSVVLSRARFCRNLAPAYDAPPESAFTVGLLSGLAEILGLPPAELVASLPLTEALIAAVVEGTGPLGAVLRTAELYAGGVVERLPGVLGPQQFVEAQLGALRWTNRLLAAAG